jgi:hypothetical protein
MKRQKEEYQDKSTIREWFQKTTGSMTRPPVISSESIEELLNGLGTDNAD